MDITITSGKLAGIVQAIPSKSQAHRILICAAFADKQTTVICPQTNEDIEATADCLRAMGADIQKVDNGYVVTPVKQVRKQASLPCRESGSTLRFMLPVAGALGIDATFQMEGRLPQRPLSPLWEEMERMGCLLTRPTENTIRCQGALRSGIYSIDGGVSSQFITGLMFALSLIDGESQIEITGNIESLPYIRLTQQVLSIFGISTDRYKISGSRPFLSPGFIQVEGDWSNAAFFLAAQELGQDLQISGLDLNSTQGDLACKAILSEMPNKVPSIDCRDIPDLVPILSIVAAYHNGATFHGINRLRLKESDRVESVIRMLDAFHIRAEADESTLRVYPGEFTAAIVDSAKDHRIAMSAAIAATVATGPVTILNAECVKKSYPSFWDEYYRLGGQYEQHIR